MNILSFIGCTLIIGCGFYIYYEKKLRASANISKNISVLQNGGCASVQFSPQTWISMIETASDASVILCDHSLCVLAFGARAQKLFLRQDSENAQRLHILDIFPKDIEHSFIGKIAALKRSKFHAAQICWREDVFDVGSFYIKDAGVLITFKKGHENNSEK